MPLLLHQPLLLLNASADHHLPWRRSSPISSCQGAVTELALPQPWTPSGHPSPISPRPHPLAAAPSYSWWLSLLPWMLAVLPSLVLTSAPCVGWPVAPALDYPHARPRYNSNSHETPSCRALDVFDGISQHVPTRSAALVARTSNPATVDVVPRASPMQ
ncbi:uncharacterized protein [Zea mays]|uniref:uncharacterized protein n=1 Tax=Zea mays TaxID=4577 RepID=UPI000220C864|nr:uncharacterized protein LOC103625794 [Zea mays]|eukprot:XP_008644420.1 uncharacterized protein LOC103625794 [Zea mays]